MKTSFIGRNHPIIRLLSLFVLPLAAIQGQTIHVSDDIELANAINTANSSASEEVTIAFDNSIMLTSHLPTIQLNHASLTIDGQGFTLSRSPEASGFFRVLHISSGSVDIDRLGIRGGNTDEGSGLLIGSGSVVTLSGCTVSHNAATSEGGGIQNFGTLTLASCTVSNNSAYYGGGGIFTRGTVTLENCTISGNSTEYDGGGVAVYPIGSATLIDCTVSNNSAGAYGGGMYNGEATLTLVRTIVSGNTADNGAEIRHIGTIHLNAYNVFGHDGINNAAAFGSSYDLYPGIDDILCTSDGDTPTSLAGILDPLLADNGGPTFTHALVADSPAIDVAPEGPATDQRGHSRPYGTAFDAGAFEFRPAPVDPEEPSALLEEYEHRLVANTIRLIHCDLDPNDILGASPNHTISAGSLPRHLRFEGQFLAGTLGSIGTYRFSVSSTGGINEVRNHFIIQVIPPTLTPFISGVWVNDAYQPTVVQQERTHGDAALTDLLNIHLISGSPLRLVFDWDYIKHSYSFKIIRGSLPNGMTLRETVVNGLPTAIIEGTPTTPGESIFVVSVKDWRERGYQWIRMVVE